MLEIQRSRSFFSHWRIVHKAVTLIYRLRDKPNQMRTVFVQKTKIQEITRVKRKGRMIRDRTADY